MPPTPVSVTSAAVLSSAATSPTSDSRPTKLVSWRGRLWRGAVVGADGGMAGSVGVGACGSRPRPPRARARSGCGSAGRSSTSTHCRPARAYSTAAGMAAGGEQQRQEGRRASQASCTSCCTLGEAIAAGEQSSRSAAQPLIPPTISALHEVPPAMLRRSIQAATPARSSASATPSARSRSAEA